MPSERDHGGLLVNAPHALSRLDDDWHVGLTHNPATRARGNAWNTRRARVDAFNVIPPEVRMQGTIRSLTTAGLAFLQDRVRAIAEGTAAAHRCTAEVTFPGEDYPPTVNDAESWALARQVGAGLLGADAVREMTPIMGGEDFSYVLERVPGCFVMLGVGKPEIGADKGLHHPQFIADEAALPIGAALHAAFALRSLEALRA